MDDSVVSSAVCANRHGSGFDQTGDGGDGFVHFFVGHRTALGGGASHATVEMVFEQNERRRFEGAGRRGDLGEYVYAVRVTLDHRGDGVYLAFDAAHAGHEFAFVVDVTHVGAGEVIG